MTEPLKTALVVDDELQVRSLTCRALSNCGFQCDEACDGVEALRLANSSKYDAVVTDLRMPNRHGHALCNDLMKLADPPNVMVLTALQDARLVRDLLERGVYAVVQKPVKYDELATQVLGMVDKNQAQSQNVAATETDPLHEEKVLKQIETTLHALTELHSDRLVPIFEGTDNLTDPPAAMRDFVKRITKNESLGNDFNGLISSRMQERVSCFTLATAVPVDRHWNPVDEPFRVAIRDISEGGLRLLNTRATYAEQLALSWRATHLEGFQLKLVAKVVWCKPFSRFYDIGCQIAVND